MSQGIKTVMVLGGSGNIGPYIVSALLKAGFQVSILSRNTFRASSDADKAPVVKSDYTPESLLDAFQGQDAVVNAVPVTHFEDQQKIIDAAIAAKVKRFLPNEFGVDNSAEPVGELATTYFKAKRDIVAYLRQKQVEGLSWTALCTGSWIDWSLSEEQSLLGFDIKRKTGTLLDNGDHKFIATTVGKVGEAVAAVLLHEEATMNQYVHVSSFSLTQRLVWETLESVLDCKFHMGEMSVEELFAVAKKLQEEGDGNAAYHALVTAFVCSGNNAVYFPDKAAHWNKVLELEQKEMLHEMMRRVLANVSGDL